MRDFIYTKTVSAETAATKPEITVERPKVELIAPYKGELVDLLIPSHELADQFAYAATLHSICLTERQVCDLEMLASGAFSPLRGFMSESDHKNVLENMRLADGTVFPIPITLSVQGLENIKIDSDIALRDPANDLLAIMNISEIYAWGREQTAAHVFGTADKAHPLVAEMQSWGRFNLAGELRVLKLPEHRHFQTLILTPTQTRERLQTLGRNNVAAFQTRNPIHRAHELITQRAIDMIDGTLLLHPVVGMTKGGDIDGPTRVRTYKAVADVAYPADRVLLSILPLAMRMAGPREAVWHAIIRRNFGADHFIVGRDHASPGADKNGRPFYEPFAAQELAQKLSPEIGVKVLEFNEIRYVPDERRYEEVGKISRDRKTLSLSGTQIREDFLNKGRELPGWFTRKEVASILSSSYPPRHRQGVCLWFTGLSGAGKSTTAEMIESMLLEEGRKATMLDGDVVRMHLSKGLGFSRQDRNTNVERIGFVASEIVRHGGVVICAAVSPYRESRDDVRAMFEKGHFIEIFVDTSLEVCEQRDTKGLYAQARRGELANLTGIGDVYEAPLTAEITLRTVGRNVEDNAKTIVEFLRAKGFLKTSFKQSSKESESACACLSASAKAAGF